MARLSQFQQEVSTFVHKADISRVPFCIMNVERMPGAYGDQWILSVSYPGAPLGAKVSLAFSDKRDKLFSSMQKYLPIHSVVIYQDTFTVQRARGRSEEVSYWKLDGVIQLVQDTQTQHERHGHTGDTCPVCGTTNGEWYDDFVALTSSNIILGETVCLLAATLLESNRYELMYRTKDGSIEKGYVRHSKGRENLFGQLQGSYPIHAVHFVMDEYVPSGEGNPIRYIKLEDDLLCGECVCGENMMLDLDAHPI